MERAILITVDFDERKSWSAEERSLELAELAYSAGAKVVKKEIARRHEVDPAHFIGKGKAEEIAGLCADEHANIVIFNNDLSPTQQKNLEEMMKVKVIDRTQLILDIFARRAHTNEGKLQIELAQLSYLLPRLTGKGVMLSRLGGGIGTRGPGEQKLEVDRRRIRERISRLEKSLEDLGKRRSMMRKNRERFSLLTIAIIGYTNVGKSTLLNALTDSRVVVEDKLFATLDSTVRRFIMPNRQKVLFVDTVGFLDRLPHHLIEAFKATLEEVVEADLLLHVVDISHPKSREQSEAVYGILEEIGAKGKPIITVLNKIDKMTEEIAIERAKTYFDSTVAVSAQNKTGFDDLIGRILPYMNDLMATVNVDVPLKDNETLSIIYENGLVLKREYVGENVRIEADVPLRIKAMLDSRRKQG